MKQVAPERVLLNQLLQIAMRRHHYAYVYLDRFVSTDAFYLALFQYPQQFRLHGHRHITNLIQE